ncbi:MAG: hypothetical protein K2K15_00075, partial [Anaeroplasmataceae bacterium]|nr:hypothetical protein [Anaeroplasmataceae bacterium]
DSYNNDIYPIEMELKVKAKEPTETIETINIDNIVFLLEFPLKDDYKNAIVGIYEEIGEYRHGADEFTKNFEWIHRLYFLNDNLGTFLVDDGKEHEYYDKTEKRLKLMPDYCVVPYRSLNRLYEKGLITKDDYLDRLIGYRTDYKTDFEIRYYGATTINGVDKGHLVYISKNIRVYFKWRPEYLELEKKYYSNSIDSKDLAKELVGILYEKKIISLEQYTAELQLIEEGLLTEPRKGVYKEAFIPFDVPMELYYDYIVE